MLSALVVGRNNYNGFTYVCTYCLHCFSQQRLLEAHLPECSINPEQKIIYSSADNLEENVIKFNAVAKTLSVPFVFYAYFEAFLVAVEENRRSPFQHQIRTTAENERIRVHQYLANSEI